jgi:predicted nucleic acid-binding protein
VPSPVLGEIGYLLQLRVGPQAEVTFLRSSGGEEFKVAGLQGTGTGRPAELMETYIDLPPGIAGAAVAAIAERLGLTGIATPDHRHFTVIRPRHMQAFTLLPGPGHALS